MAFKTYHLSINSYATTENAVTNALHDMSKYFVKPPWLHCLYMYTYIGVSILHYIPI